MGMEVHHRFPTPTDLQRAANDSGTATSISALELCDHPDDPSAISAN
jgi:hypothetical protein